MIYRGPNTPYGRGTPAAALPAWRSAMAAGTWATIPGNTLSAVDPGVAPNDVTPSGADWETRGMTAGLLSWTGACFDDANGVLWIPVGGGHTDYGGNEPYKINLNTTSPTWQMVRPPSGHSGVASVTTRDSQEATGVYSDGRIRAQHSYSNPVYIPGQGPALGRSTAHHYSGTGHVPKVRVIDPLTGESSVLSDYSAFTGMGNGEGAAVYDASRNSVWTLGAATSTLVQIDCATGTATKRGATDNWLITSGNMVYVPTLDCLVCYPNNNGSGDVAVRNLTTYTASYPTLTGSWSTGFGFTVADDGFGMTWCNDLGCILLWNNTTSRTEISTLTPTGGAGDPWTKGVLAVSGSNAVTPDAANGTGTFGRFGYSNLLGGCYLVNNTTSSVYFFATR